MADYRKYDKTKIRRRSSLRRRPWIIVVILVLMIAAAVCGYLIFHSVSDVGHDDSRDSVPEQTDPKGVHSEADDPNAEQGRAQTPTQYDGEDSNALDEITGYISYTAVNYDHYSIRLTINQYISSGTCILSMSSGDSIVNREADVESAASTATCQGFDIPLSELPSGTWDISIKVTAGDGRTGVIGGEISI